MLRSDGYRVTTESIAPSWIPLPSASRRYFERITSLDLWDCTAAPGHLARVSDLTRLKRLVVIGVDVDDPAAFAIGKLSRLEILGLPDRMEFTGSVADNDMELFWDDYGFDEWQVSKIVVAFPELLGRTRRNIHMSDRGIASLAECRHLRKLWLDVAKLSDTASAAVGRLRQLEQLALVRATR